VAGRAKTGKKEASKCRRTLLRFVPNLKERGRREHEEVGGVWGRKWERDEVLLKRIIKV